MGTSRRASRAKGRASSAVVSNASSHRSFGGVKKSATRAARKAKLLSAARASRELKSKGPPRLIALVPLSQVASSQLEIVRNSLASAKGANKLQFLALQRHGSINGAGTWCRDWTLAVLDAAKVADIVAFVFADTDAIDNFALDIIACLRSQGLTVVISVAIGSSSGDVTLKRQRGRELAAESLGIDSDLRPYSLDIPGGPDRVVRYCLEKNIKPLTWRERYGYMLVEGAWIERQGCRSITNADHDSQDSVELVISGVVRGTGLDSNRLVMITGVGAFKVSRIISTATRNVLSLRDEASAEPVESEAPVDPLAGEQNWPSDGEDEDRDVLMDIKRRVPKGFSEYQAAWIPDDGDVEGSASEDEVITNQDNVPTDAFVKLSKVHNEGSTRVIVRNDDEKAVANQLGELADVDLDPDDSLSYGQELSEPMEEDVDCDGDADDDDMEVDADEVARVRAEARADAEFPDEVDTPIDKPARVRFARYRGLKSLRTSPWDPKEQLPKAYARLFQFANLRATRKRVFAHAAASSNSSPAPAGESVSVVLTEVPYHTAANVVDVVGRGQVPVVASAMLPHENRRSVVHFGLQRVDNGDSAPIKAKTPLELHCGFVRFEGRPMFSEHNSNSDKHKMERYFVHGRYTVASFYGPAVYGPAPALLFHIGGNIIASGTALGADPDRIILKRIVLTGYPFKTQKKRVVVKFMFFNPEDVRWFRPVELWTKLGRTGHITDSLGTHGRMKCIFDAPVLHHDTVCMTLYKRVYPKSTDPRDDD